MSKINFDMSKNLTQFYQIALNIGTCLSTLLKYNQINYSMSSNSSNKASISASSSSSIIIGGLPSYKR